MTCTIPTKIPSPLRTFWNDNEKNVYEKIKFIFEGEKKLESIRSLRIARFDLNIGL